MPEDGQHGTRFKFGDIDFYRRANGFGAFAGKPAFEEGNGEKARADCRRAGRRRDQHLAAGGILHRLRRDEYRLEIRCIAHDCSPRIDSFLSIRRYCLG